MRCVLDRPLQCQYEKCRYFTNNFCSLTVVNQQEWPDKDTRFKNKNVKAQGKEEIREMPISGPGCCSD